MAVRQVVSKYIRKNPQYLSTSIYNVSLVDWVILWLHPYTINHRLPVILTILNCCLKQIPWVQRRRRCSLNSQICLSVLERSLDLASELPKVPKDPLWEVGLYLSWHPEHTSHPANILQTPQRLWRCFPAKLHFTAFFIQSSLAHHCQGK